MSKRKLLFGSLVMVGLLLVASSSQAGVLWTFKNQHNIDGFSGTGGWPAEPLANCAITWDAAGKLVATGSGAGNPIEFGTMLTYPNASHGTVFFSMHPLITWRMQVSGGPATNNHGIVIAFTSDGKYLGKDFHYDSGDLLIQQDFTDSTGRFGEADPATAEINGIRFYMSYDVAAAQVCKFDWIALGDADMLANTPPVYLQEFDDSSAVDGFTEITQIQLDLSWVTGGYMRQAVTTPYTDPELYFPLGPFSGGENPYVFIKMSATNPPDSVNNKGCILGFFDSPDSTFVAKNFNFHPGANLIVNDPSVQGVNINVPGVEVGTPLWRNFNVNPLRIDCGDDPDQLVNWQNLVVDYDYLAAGGSILWMLEKEFTFVDSDGDGLSDTMELGIGTDAGEADSDGDGLTDGEEIDLGTNPNAADTDGDGYSDKDEVDAGTDPLDNFSYPGHVAPAAGIVMLGLLAGVSLGLGVKALRKG